MRKKNSIFNILATLGASFSAIIVNFIVQRVIIITLGVEYSGANGLFTNILNMLSIAELGIGSAIVFKLYKPIADNDTESIKSWMKFYKLCYRWIAIIILVVGLSLSPFIPLIIGKASIKENLILLYILSLIDVVLSYTLTYKRSLLYAYQKNYIVNIIHTLYFISLSIGQVLVLYLTNNYMIFVIVKIVFRVLENVIINIYVNQKYPYVREDAESISKTEQKDIFNRIKAIFVQKVSYQVNKGIDNIIITRMLGIVATGFYTNYHLIVVAIIRVVYWISSSMTASVGDLLTENNYQKNYNIYRRMNLFNTCLTCISIVGFACAVQPFIKIWVGGKYILSIFIVLSFAFYIYSDSIRNSIRLFKEAAGICREDKNTYIVAIIINIFTSIILCKMIGISGVILGTAISYIYLYLYSYPKYIFKPIFKKDKKEYYKENLIYFIYIVVSLTCAMFICNRIVLASNIAQFVINTIVAISISIIMFWLFFSRTKEYKYYLNLLKRIFNRKKLKDV